MSLCFDKYFTEAEEKQLFGTVKQFRADVLAWRDYNWMKLARGTGVRLCVLVGLTVGDAQRVAETEYLTVRAEINKRKKAQELYAVKSVKMAFHELVLIHKKMSAGIEWEVEANDRPLILSRNHKGMSARSFQSRMSMWVKKSGLTDGSVHWWRHTLGKRMMSNGQGDEMKNLRRAQVIFGHSELRTTEIYTKPDKESLKELMIDAT